MRRMIWVRWFGASLSALFVCAGSANARDIGGTISTTLTITENSQLVDDVTCTVTGAACIAFGASNITLDLNGFTMTGLGNSETGCGGGPTTLVIGSTEDGVFAIMREGVTIRGPGLIQRFRGSGILTSASSKVTVKEVTAATNCFSGIFVGGGSENDVSSNISVRNGNGTFPCGGI